MRSISTKSHINYFFAIFLAATCHVRPAGAADKLNFIYTARVMSQSYPWIAQEAGLF